MCQGHDLIHLLINLGKGRTKQIKSQTGRHQEAMLQKRLHANIQREEEPLHSLLWLAHLLIGDLQQVQHHSMGPHVLQQPLLLHTTLLTGKTQLTESQQYLQMKQEKYFTYLYTTAEKDILRE